MRERERERERERGENEREDLFCVNWINEREGGEWERDRAGGL